LAEAELTFNYRKKSVRNLYYGAVGLLPFMVMGLAWTTIVLLVKSSSSHMQMSAIVLLITFNFLLTVLCALAAALAADEVVFITRDGINLPFFVCPGFYFRVRKKWADLTGMHFSQEGAGGKLTLMFKNGARTALDLAMVPPDSLNQLIMALDVWTEGADNFAALLEARTHMLLPAGESNKQSSYTDLWQEELGRRFGATNFIPLEPGHKVMEDLYTIERQLAFGGMSAIYLARRKDLVRVVLKEAVVPHSGDENLLKTSHDMLEREAKMLAALSHEQIARVFDHFVDGGRHYLVLEYIPGQDLRALVHESGPQSADQVLIWARTMAELLAYLHERSEPIIHRDFTPDNILLKDNGSIVLIDFGAANFFIGTATGTMIGKQAYIAPEQLRGKACVQSDIYALGATLFYLLTGQDPEPLSVSRPSEAGIAGGGAINADFDDLIAQCTQMEKEDRPQSAAEVLKRLKQIRPDSVEQASHAQ
jgi:tRNA A-37 threonylcarbamoyl transferase component Bud32